jgi:hypothetical protein
MRQAGFVKVVQAPHKTLQLKAHKIPERDFHARFVESANISPLVKAISGNFPPPKKSFPANSIRANC